MPLVVTRDIVSFVLFIHGDAFCFDRFNVQQSRASHSRCPRGSVQQWVQLQFGLTIRFTLSGKPSSFKRSVTVNDEEYGIIDLLLVEKAIRSRAVVCFKVKKQITET